MCTADYSFEAENGGVALGSHHKHHDSMPLQPSHTHSKAFALPKPSFCLTCDLLPIRKMLKTFPSSLPLRPIFINSPLVPCNFH